MLLSRKLKFFCIFILSGYILWSQPQSKLSYTLSLEQSNPAKFHVEFLCEGLKGEIKDFKMPAIAPGYYRVLDFAGKVENFNVQDLNGNPMPWEKISKNTWRLGINQCEAIQISYDVKSNHDSVADSFIDEKRAYIAPPGIFLYPDRQIDHPVTVSMIPPDNFLKISTGLEPVKDKANTFYAKNYDILYDSPIYIGNQEVISFDVKGITHRVSMENPGIFDRNQFAADLKKMIETATTLIGEIPYPHYTFIFMDEGKGGLEHWNSTAVFLNVSGNENPWRKDGLMDFLTHEYFHLYNVKSIRPIALGPFNYDGENYTDMLWLSEGATVYYEYIILNRAGFLNRKECLDRMSKVFANNQNNPAHLTQSVAEASRKAWTQSFFGNPDEVSYYDKGLVLSVLLDLKIRHETGNNKSLDDVMRTCYQEFYKKRQRGFTQNEFQQVCEKLAGTSLKSFFDLIHNTEEIDYEKYFSCAGLTIQFIDDDKKSGKKKCAITPISNPNPLQKKILQNWLNE